MKRIISIVLPDGYKDAEAFAEDCNVEVWCSSSLSHLTNLTSQLRGYLLDNKPVQAFMTLQLIEQETARITHTTRSKGGQS